MNVPFFSLAVKTFSASEWDFLSLFSFQRFKIKRLEGKCFTINYFSFIKPGGELFQLFVELYFPTLLCFSLNTSGKANLI